MAGVSGDAKGQGLAGGAIVFFYGVIVASIALFVSLFIAYKSEVTDIIKINKILGILLQIAVGLISYRIVTLNKENFSDHGVSRKIDFPGCECTSPPG